jgi:hypothetical protein
VLTHSPTALMMLDLAQTDMLHETAEKSGDGILIEMK